MLAFIFMSFQSAFKLNIQQSSAPNKAYPFHERHHSIKQQIMSLTPDRNVCLEQKKRLIRPVKH